MRIPAFLGLHRAAINGAVFPTERDGTFVSARARVTRTTSGFTPRRTVASLGDDHTRGQAETYENGAMGPPPPGWISKWTCGGVPRASPLVPT